MGKKGYDQMTEVLKWFAGNTLKHEAPRNVIERVIAIKIGTDPRTIKKYFDDMVFYGLIAKMGKTNNYQLNHYTWLKTIQEEIHETINNGNIDKIIKELRISPIKEDKEK